MKNEMNMEQRVSAVVAAESAYEAVVAAGYASRMAVETSTYEQALEAWTVLLEARAQMDACEQK